MENLENVAVVVYFVFIVVFMFFGKVIWASREVKSKLSRFLMAVFIFPAMGCIFWVFGKIGDFMLLAFSHLF